MNYSSRIRWLDFEWDSHLGPLLAQPEQKFREAESRRGLIQEEARRRSNFQETGQGELPARMVGVPETDSKQERQSGRSREASTSTDPCALRMTKEGG